MKKRMIDQINQLQFSTASSLKIVQEARVPKLFDLGAERRMMYSYNGYTYPIRTANRLVFYCRNIPYRNLNKRKNNLVFIDTMINLVKRNEIEPFLVFINGAFVKWSNISIIHDFKYSYLVIDNINTTTYKSIHAIYLPFSVAYNEQGMKYGPPYDIFTFNDKGLLDPIGNINIAHTAKNFYYKTDRSYTGFLNVEIDNIEPEYKMSDLNIITFRDGRLYSDSEVKMDAFNIFSIDNGGYLEGSYVDYKVFYYKTSNKSNDNIYRFKDNDVLKNIIKKRARGIKPPGWFELLEKPFNFKFANDKTYEMNIEEGISYIMNYNPLLMTDMFKGAGDIESRQWYGKDFKALATNGIIMLPRTLDQRMFDNYVMMFVNGLLYEYHLDISYENKYVSIPIQGIQDDDIVELLYFKNIDNRRIIMNMDKEDRSANITDPTIILDNAELFYRIPFNPDYDLDEAEEIEYNIPFVILTTEEGKRLKPSLSFYYDKDLVLGFKNQFRYRRFNITKEDTLYIDLPEDFWYCKEEHSFMCFVNRTRLGFDEFKITIPKSTRPFDDIRLYTVVPLQPGDTIDLFYVGTYMEEIVNLPKMNVTGDVIIDKSKIAYGLSKDLYMVFLNGFKVPPQNMIDVGTSFLKITNNYDTVKNLSIVKYIQDDDIINSYIQSNDSLWDNIINMIPKVVIEELFDTEDKIFVDTYERFDGRSLYSLKTILLEIIQEYWLIRRYSTGEPFVYDYDTSVFENVEGTWILDALDANNEERIIHTD